MRAMERSPAMNPALSSPDEEAHPQANTPHRDPSHAHRHGTCACRRRRRPCALRYGSQDVSRTGRSGRRRSNAQGVAANCAVGRCLHDTRPLGHPTCREARSSMRAGCLWRESKSTGIPRDLPSFGGRIRREAYCSTRPSTLEIGMARSAPGRCARVAVSCEDRTMGQLSHAAAFCCSRKRVPDTGQGRAPAQNDRVR